MIELLKLGVEADKRDNEGNTPLIRLCHQVIFEHEVLVLLEYGADVNKINNKGETPLIAACIGKHII
ncbi:hypothetical protein BCR36DRAFT_584397 [Piromyces finnis]|uniref:Uncharacterized protein n=1 Tax=Piromyces finnis TaxID=1754191 RepID=A0A1Y1V7T5_9FUNG|nr:hypothetical protein BCR36DRAFT_584397 [Piromyces finnis]|eukprot:ORX48083.1 hypothetical protein BCR36DRAFT_584397 [Piromyces finnis]